MQTVLTLDVSVSSDADLLPRIIAVCHRRQLLVVSLHFERGARSENERLVLVVEGPASQGLRLRKWLTNLVGVKAACADHPSKATAINAESVVR